MKIDKAIKWIAAVSGVLVFAATWWKFGWQSGLMVLIGETMFSLYGTFNGKEDAKADE